MEENCKESQKASATIVFADDAGIQLAPNVRRTWAPIGKTPVIFHATRSYRKVSTMGAIAVTPGGRKARLFFRLLENANFKSESCIAFIEQLKANIKGRIVLVWERFQAHRSKKMNAFLAKQKRVRVEYFPSYAPELNPVEYVWGYLKMNKLSNKVEKDVSELCRSAKAGMCGIRRKQPLVKQFVDHSPLGKIWCR